MPPGRLTLLGLSWRGWGFTSGFLKMAFLAWVCWSHFSDQLTEAKGNWLPCGQYGQVWVCLRL